jgi:hypothetical protein
LIDWFCIVLLGILIWDSFGLIDVLGIRNLNKKIVLNSRKSSCEFEDDKNYTSILDLKKLQFSPWTLENLQFYPWNIFWDSRKNWLLC